MTQLYLDMDGVLADFDTGYRQRFGRQSDKLLDDVDWNAVRRTPGFYRDLPPMPDLDELWDGVKHLDPIILTGVPKSVDEALDNKREWVKRWLGSVPMVGCLSKDKCLHGKPGDVLIDDWEKHKDAWTAMGGHWITHISAKQSLADLQSYLNKETTN